MSGSIWKKEFSLRKKDEETLAEEVPFAAPAESAEPAAAEPVDRGSNPPRQHLDVDQGGRAHPSVANPGTARTRPGRRWGTAVSAPSSSSA